jgi:uncharacterized cysteine cluster protein YcgN (CxxCxxCC family)
MTNDFWKTTKLADMMPEQWELLCDGCGKCCLHKIEDADEEGAIYYTNVACKLLDLKTAKCTDYSNRKTLVAGCTVLDVNNINSFYWLPSTCAYRRLAEGKSLPKWHPLRSGDTQSTIKQGRSVVGLCVSERDVKEEDYEEHLINWIA